MILNLFFILMLILVQPASGSVGTEAVIKSQGAVSSQQVVRPSHIQVSIEPASGDVYQVSDAPWTTTLCEETQVYGNPYGMGDVLYELSAGAEVLVHEPSTLNDGWYMIEPAEWLYLAQCEA